MGHAVGHTDLTLPRPSCCTHAGVLLRRLQSDPELEGVGAVLFDEFHERNLDADTALALCLDVQVRSRVTGWGWGEAGVAPWTPMQRYCCVGTCRPGSTCTWLLVVQGEGRALGAGMLRALRKVVQVDCKELRAYWDTVEVVVLPWSGGHNLLPMRRRWPGQT